MTNTTTTATAPRAIYAGIGWPETPQTTLADMTLMHAGCTAPAGT